MFLIVHVDIHVLEIQWKEWSSESHVVYLDKESSINIKLLHFQWLKHGQRGFTEKFDWGSRAPGSTQMVPIF